MKFFYGEAKEEVILHNLLKRLENKELLTKKELQFVERKLSDGKRRKLWAGFDFTRNGLKKALERVGNLDSAKTETSEECQDTQK